MNPSLTKITGLNHKPRTILGLMSGTSLDGLDIALCKISGDGLTTSLEVLRYKSICYNNEFLSILKPIFANPNAPLKEITSANAWIAREHASMVTSTLAMWGLSNNEVDILASHGQTIFHNPNSLCLREKNKAEGEQKLASATLQIGDGDHLAYLTQILTVSDFRQKHVAAGGEGAPLVPYADYLLFSNTKENRILVNIGGIANFTFIPRNAAFSRVVSADSGPGNTLMDAVIQCVKELSSKQCLPRTLPPIGKLYDADGAFAAQGSIDEILLNIMLAEFNALLLQKNKSTGQETFNIDFVYLSLLKRMKESLQSPDSSSLIAYLKQSNQAFYDLIATLNLFTAKTIGAAIETLNLSATEAQTTTIYLSGGGVHNPVLVANIQECVSYISVKFCDELGINADAKEAALFAVLANQTLFGDSSVFTNSNEIPACAFGKISLP